VDVVCGVGVDSGGGVRDCVDCGVGVDSGGGKTGQDVRESMIKSDMELAMLIFMVTPLDVLVRYKCLLLI
jgi:hypothetical protein